MPNLIEFVFRADGRSALKFFKQLEDSSKKSSKQVKEDADKNALSFDRMHRSARGLTSGIGALGGMAGFGGLAFGIKDAVTGAMSFQSQMTMLQTNAGASASQVRQMSNAVLDLSGKVGIGPSGLATGLYHIVSSMNSVTPAAQRQTKEMQALKIAAEGAQIGHANLEDVTNALGGAIASGLPGVQNYSAAMNQLLRTVGTGDMHLQDLADAFGTGLLGPMKNFGVGLTDVDAALAVFGDNNLRGQEAATKLNSAIRIMAAPSGAAAKALGKIGMTQFQMATDLRKPQGLLVALKDLRQHLLDSGLTAEQQAGVITEAFGGKQSTGVQLLLGQVDRLQSKYGELGSIGGLGSAFATTQHTPAQQMAQFKAQLQATADKIGITLIPTIGHLATDGAWLAGAFSRLPGPLQASIVGLTALGVIAGPLKNSFELLNGMTKLLAGTEEKAAGQTAVAGAESGAGGALTGAGAAGAASRFGKLGKFAKGGMLTLAGGLAGSAVRDITGIGKHHGKSSGIGAIVGTVAGGALGSFVPIPGATFVGAGLGNLAGGFVGSLFHNGGVVHPLYRASGGPIGTDTVPAWLTPGEGVVNRRGMGLLGPGGLNAINAGMSPGGMVQNQPIVVNWIVDGRVLAKLMTDAVVRQAARGPSSLVGGSLMAAPAR